MNPADRLTTGSTSGNLGSSKGSSSSAVSQSRPATTAAGTPHISEPGPKTSETINASGILWKKDFMDRSLWGAEDDIKDFYREHPTLSNVTTQGPNPSTFQGVSWREISMLNKAYRKIAESEGRDQWTHLRRANRELEDMTTNTRETDESWGIQARLLEGYQKEFPGYPESAAEEEDEDNTPSGYFW
jgi:hypothetical protein